MPKSQPNDKQGHTWRFSFSLAEVEISKMIPPIARQCFVTLKVIRKDFLKTKCGKLKSYHLKTIFMWVLEKTQPHEWNSENAEVVFHSLLDAVIKAVSERYCPHYWLNDINLFEDFTLRDAHKLHMFLNRVKRNPTHYINIPTSLGSDVGR